MSLTVGRYHFPRGLPDAIEPMEVEHNHDGDGQYRVHYLGGAGRLQDAGLMPKPLLQDWVEEVAAAYPDWVEVLPEPMPREEAISTIYGAFVVEESRCIGDEAVKTWAEFRDAMLALGATKDELKGYVHDWEFQR